ncbi:transcriptional regulator, LacI family [Deinococcus reticulitermitis]|uniref:Transcriptional regulator, LacI family n=1 Tax=Deinococcus reticulitermitis TaxID=856736 RepID=A0A1H7CEA5_9DEIO|nr:LacI family DNA-binding transcriptional regulator [Deinococcus reticulitermitis]SEJ86907.1 transcriptional regulator, LacI family [Deinococcus reticulitermitis]
MASPTINDIAERAGVSPMTVSHALRQTGRISESTRKRVLQIAAELNYVANTSARQLKGARTNVIGMLVIDVTLPYYATIAQGVGFGASERRRDFLMFSTLGMDCEKEQKRVAQFSSGLVDGLILISRHSSLELLRRTQKLGCRVVLINEFEEDTGLSIVNAENSAGTRSAMKHLIDLGHTRIAFIHGDQASVQNGLRAAAYREAMQDNGLPIPPGYMPEGHFQTEGGMLAAWELLNRPDPPTAIFAANDDMAAGVIEAARQKGLRVPEDLSVVGFDDFGAAQLSPPLTTVRHPLFELGRQASLLLCDQLDGLRETQSIELPSELIVRQSTAPPPRP